MSSSSLLQSLAEVPFCGHATIAAAVAVAGRDGAGPLVFNTGAGRVDINTAVTDDGPTASLISVPPRAWHPIIALAERDRLAALDYEFDRLGALMASRDWTTIDVVWRARAEAFVARNPFPPGGVVEDPATGAAAAAFGGYLREIGALVTPASITIEQGEFISQPGRIIVNIPADPDTGSPSPELQSPSNSSGIAAH